MKHRNVKDEGLGSMFLVSGLVLDLGQTVQLKNRWVPEIQSVFLLESLASLGPK